MARPRIFVSSTYYDLKHLRSALEGFIDGLGFEPVLSEKGNIAYAPDLALDESCYREARQADIMVLIIGGRYGSEKSGTSDKESSDFYSRYDSITREEFRSAEASGVPLYILIERGVQAEYQTYLKNRESTGVRYAHVDSVNIFQMIQEILGLKRNNPVFAFDRYHEIEAWLREQWAGLFQELLQRRSSQEQLTSLSAQVSQLRESNKTLKAYLESLMRHVSPEESETVIDAESKRLNELNKYRAIEDNGFVMFLGGAGLDLIQIGVSLSEAKTVVSLFKTIRPHIDETSTRSIEILDEILMRQPDYALRDINDARNRLGLAPLKWGVRQKKPDIVADILGEG
ncbi:MAG: DUF4062 domain-containing protein [Bacteroidota bacterium]